jgi:ribulose-5-phosphate 4-epimerase/fuculose-1-phosphate aldolase
VSTVTVPRIEIAHVARMLSRAGLIEAFGHVSARLTGGGFVLTPTSPLLDAGAEEVLELTDGGDVLVGERCPLEAPLHAAVYAARPDVGAICRTHSRHAAAWASRGEAPPLVHGLGGLSGELAVHDSPQLVCTVPSGAAAAASLGAADCLLLRANGALCTGRDLPRAAVRAWFLEERARVATDAPAACAITDDELRERSRHFEVESERAWQWLQARFGKAGENTHGDVTKEVS